MSWRNTDSVYEGLDHIVDAFKDNLPCRGYIWNDDENKDFDDKCLECPVYYRDKWAEEEDNCYIRNTYLAIEKIDEGEE